MITIVSSWCWEGLYIDGQLRCENERISLRKFLECVPHDLQVEFLDGDHFTGDGLPHLLSDFVAEQGVGA